MQVIKNITIIDKQDCMGCHACFNQCPVQASKMSADSEGFLYPIVDENKCVNCGQCLDACPIQNKPAVLIERGAYAAYAKDAEEHATSSSGGIFAVLARYILQNGGYVCGAAFDDSVTLKHILTNKEEDLKRIKGTK